MSGALGHGMAPVRNLKLEPTWDTSLQNPSRWPPDLQRIRKYVGYAGWLVLGSAK